MIAFGGEIKGKYLALIAFNLQFLLPRNGVYGLIPLTLLVAIIPKKAKEISELYFTQS